MSDAEPREPEGATADLLLGLLPEAERSALLARLADDPEAEREFLAAARRFERARAMRRPGLAERSAPRRVVPMRPMAVVLAMAAVVIVALFLRPDPESSLQPVPLPIDAERLHLRSSETPAGVIDGLEAYRQGHWRAAIARLEAEPDAARAGLVRDLYLASALALDGEFERALVLLEGLPLADVPEPWASEARWTQAVCLHRVGRFAEAEAARADLARGEGPVAERARKADFGTGR